MHAYTQTDTSYSRRLANVTIAEFGVGNVLRTRLCPLGLRGVQVARLFGLRSAEGPGLLAARLARVAYIGRFRECFQVSTLYCHGDRTDPPLRTRRSHCA